MKTATVTKTEKSSAPMMNGSRQNTPRADLRESTDSCPAPTDKVREGIREIAEETKTKVADTAAAIAQVAREKVDETKAKVTEFTETSKQKAERKYEETIDTVSRKPAGALGIAAGFGILVGLAVASLISGRRA